MCCAAWRPQADAVVPYGAVTTVLIRKTRLTLTLLHNDTPLHTYPVAIGAGGFADKVCRGDRKTPEGEFYITEKLVLDPNHSVPNRYLGSRWMRLSYPNIEDAERGYNSGLITLIERDQIIDAVLHRQTPPQDTALGGGIGIHGGSGNNSDTQGSFWTHGCIGMNDADVAELFALVQLRSTPILIMH